MGNADDADNFPKYGGGGDSDTSVAAPAEAIEPVDSVGYKRPPTSHQFSKGKSGNSKGRPRGSRSFKTELREVLEQKIPVTENGRKVTITARQAMLMRLRQQALAGDGRAVDRLLRLAVAHLPDEVLHDDGKTAAEDRALLDRLMADLPGVPASRSGSNDE